MQLIQEVYAQETTATGAAKSEFSFASFIPLILIFAVFYFLIIRPQSKKMKAQQDMVNNLKIGDKVLTNGGIIGVIKGFNEKENLVELKVSEGNSLNVVRNYIIEIKTDKKEEKKNK